MHIGIMVASSYANRINNKVVNRLRQLSLFVMVAGLCTPCTVASYLASCLRIRTQNRHSHFLTLTNSKVLVLTSTWCALLTQGDSRQRQDSGSHATHEHRGFLLAAFWERVTAWSRAESEGELPWRNEYVSWPRTCSTSSSDSPAHFHFTSYMSLLSYNDWWSITIATHVLSHP